MIERWTSDKIRTELKSKRIPMVQRRGDEYLNLGWNTAARMEGTYAVESRKYEIIVDMNSQKKGGQ